MEISWQQAIGLLNRWKQDGSAVGLHFAARVGTAGSTMLARIAEISSRIVFKNDSGSFQFGLIALGMLNLLVFKRFPHSETSRNGRF